MKQQPNPLHQLPLRQKIILAFTIPIIMTMTVTMFAVVGFKQIADSNQAIREKVAGETKQQTELLELLEQGDKRIQIILRQVILVTIISIILMILLAFVIARGIHANQQQAGSGLPEIARNELLAMRQQIDEILRRS